jgi:GNAT superfamily N-acetyltransferase
MSNNAVSLRLATETDEPFLERLFSACRYSDFASLDEPFATQMVQSQFVARRRDWADRFDVGGDHIIEVEDHLAGRLWIHSDGDCWELVDIAVLPEFRNRGIAGTLLRDLVEQAEANNATIRLTVRVDNTQAQRIYLRLGFSIEPSGDIDLRMVLRPSAQQREQTEAFRRRVLTDPLLWNRLVSVPKAEFEDQCAAVANEHGFDLDALDVRNALRDAKSAWLMRWV